MIRRILLMLGLMASVSLAQPQKIKTTIVTYALGGPGGGFKAFYKTGEEIKPFGANGAGLSEPIRYEGPLRFEIRAAEADFSAPPEGQQPKPPLAFVNLPENSNNVLVLAAEEAGKIRLVAFDISTNNLRAGDYKLFNFSHSTLSIILGSQRLVLQPAQNNMMKDPSWQDEKPKALEFKIAKIENQKPLLIKETVWEHWSGKRTVIFMFDGKHKGEPIGIMSFNVEPPAKEQEQAGQ